MKGIVKATIPEQILSILREEILSGRIPSGERLTTVALQQRFGVSSTPVREALKRLAADGLVDHATHVGGRVVALGAEDVSEIYALVRILDTGALRLACASPQAARLARELGRNVAAEEAALAAGDLARFRALSDEFHDLLFKAAGNRRLHESALRVRGQLGILAARYQDSADADAVVAAQHRGIAEAVAAGDAEEAAARLARHFADAERTLLARLGPVSPGGPARSGT